MTSFSFTPPVLSDPDCDPVKLKAIGDSVRERLRAYDGARELGGELLDLFVIPEFLSKEECARLVEVIDSRIGPSTLFKGTEIDGFRTSSTHHFDRGDPATVEMEGRLAQLLGLDPSHAEVMQGQRYMPGQQYKHHHDFFHADQPYWANEKIRGGQRTWTAMIFLNEPEDGGETDYKSLKLKIPPKTGAIVIWNNMNRSGRPNHDTLHSGTPVIKGSKYVITQWFRQNPWIFDPHNT